MILYINEEHCSSLEQLKGYFTEDLTAESPIYYDLLDYGRSGDISEWLKEMEEDEMSAKVALIDSDLSDSKYFVELKSILTGATSTTPHESLKPPFEKCFKLEGYEEEPNGSTEMIVTMKFKVLMTVNERYELKITSSWGTRGQQINPSDYIEGEAIKVSLLFRKCPGDEWKINFIKAEEKVLLYKDDTILPIKNKEKLPKIANLLQKGEDLDESFIETVKGVSFKMIKVEGGTFKMGAQAEYPNRENYDREASSDEGPVHSVSLGDYYIAETEVTQKLWKVVMGRNRSHPQSDNLPANNISWNDCQEFIKKLNRLTGKTFRLPTEAEWEYAARGGNKSNGYKYSGSNKSDDVAWNRFNTNSMCRVRTKKTNELGIYGMSGNVREWCEDKYYNRYNPNLRLSSRMSSNGGNYVLRGGSYVDQNDSCRVSARHYNNVDKTNIRQGLRLVCIL